MRMTLFYIGYFLILTAPKFLKFYRNINGYVVRNLMKFGLDKSVNAWYNNVKERELWTF